LCVVAFGTAYSFPFVLVLWGFFGLISNEIKMYAYHAAPWSNPSLNDRDKKAVDVFYNVQHVDIAVLELWCTVLYLDNNVKG
jgi:hypothetical protein